MIIIKNINSLYLLFMYSVTFIFGHVIPLCCCVKQDDYWRAMWNTNINLPWWSIRSFKQWSRCLADWVQHIHILIFKNLAPGASVLWEDLWHFPLLQNPVHNEQLTPPSRWWVHRLEGWGLSECHSLFSSCVRGHRPTRLILLSPFMAFSRENVQNNA